MVSSFTHRQAALLPEQRNPYIISMTNPPTITDFDTIARRVFETIPAPFAEHLTDILLRIEDWPAQEILDHFGMTSRYQLSGLYQGVPIGEKSLWAPPSGEGDRIFLYRRPLLAEMEKTGVGLENLIRHVVIHEVGHHFGLSDADMHAIEDSVED
tara:strand:- start:248 stop:712 length:465 start_codon:yes stop_codon:yes gene_type:complete